MFNVVLVRPEIPPNTGNVGRLCLATKSTLHLIKPLGFSLEDRQLKRAGLDYWEDVDLKVWDSLPVLMKANPDARCFLVTTKTKRAYWDVEFRPSDFLVFGRETKAQAVTPYSGKQKFKPQHQYAPNQTYVPNQTHVNKPLKTTTTGPGNLAPAKNTTFNKTTNINKTVNKTVNKAYTKQHFSLQ